MIICFKRIAKKPGALWATFSAHQHWEFLPEVPDFCVIGLGDSLAVFLCGSNVGSHEVHFEAQVLVGRAPKKLEWVPFEGQRLFRNALDTFIHNIARGKSTLLP